MVGRSTLSSEEMQTLLVEIKSMLNNRPLTYLYENVEGVSQPFNAS